MEGLNMKKSIFFFAALAALFSCAKENPVVETPAEETFSVELIASAPTEGTDTKTTLVEGGKFVHWSKGDAIKVLFFPDRTNGNIITGPSGVFTSHFDEPSSSEAYFRTDSWSWAGTPSDLLNDQRTKRLIKTGIAVYPSTAVAVSNKPTTSTGAALNSEISFVLPEVQNAVVGNIESGLNFSYADVDRDSFINTIDNGSKTELLFKNACALIQLTMPAEMPKVTEISISSIDDVALTGKGNMVFTTGNNEAVSGAVNVSEAGNVVLKSSEGFEAGATYYAVVWPGNHKSGLKIQFMAEDGTAATKTTPEVELTASHVKPYTFSSALNFESAAPKEYNYVYADGSQGNEVRDDIVGVVIFHGNPKTEFNDSQLPDQYCNGLAISVSSRKCAWNSTQLSSIPASVKLSGSTSVIADFSMGGYTATQAFGTNNYTVFANGTAPAGTSGWYLGAANEWKYILANKDKINKLLEGVGDAINPSQKSEAFWLPYFYSTRAAIVYISGGAPYFYYEQYYYYPTYPSYCYNARPIFAF